MTINSIKTKVIIIDNACRTKLEQPRNFKYLLSKIRRLKMRRGNKGEKFQDRPILSFGPK